MPLLDTLAGRLGFVRATTAAPVPRRRVFQAAAPNRLTAGWSTAPTSINADLKASLPGLVARSRELAQNNDYARKFLQMAATNIVGPSGFTLQMAAKLQNGRPDTSANNAIEAAWANWSRRGVCELSRKLSFVEVQQLLIETAARDGEFLVRRVLSRDANPYGYALQVLDVDRLDTQYNETLASGNRVIMGVEVDAAYAPVAYYLRGSHPGDSEWQGNQRRTKVPAEEIHHGFRANRPEQVRGVPWAHTAMLRLKHLGAYEEAAVVAARVGASKMGWITSPDGTLDALADDIDAQQQTYTEVEPGAIGMLPSGYDWKSFDPDYPAGEYGSFVMATLRGIASGLGVAYHSLANDLSSVNYSSARAGVLEERDNWMALQTWFADSFLYPVFAEWLRSALLMQAITLPNGSSLPVFKLAQFNMPTFLGRRWSWIDPLKDTQANLAAIQAGLKSRREVMAEQGRELDDVWEQLAAEQQKAAEMGLDLDGPTQSAPDTAEEPNGQPDETQNGGA